jgi:phosphatidate cytidylyltransferase
MSNLTMRILSALVALPLLFGSLWLATPYPFAVIVLAAAGLGATEYFHLAKKLGFAPPVAFGYVGVAAAVGAFQAGAERFLPGGIGLLLAAMMIWSVFTAKDFKAVLPAHAVTLFGVAYVGVLCGFLVGARQTVAPALAGPLLTLFFGIVMVGDTGAYFAGRAFGRHKLAPKISPGKTVEGAIGGFLGSVAFAFLAKAWFFPQLPTLHAALLAAVMNPLGQLGDLYESLLKRGSDAKDAASVIPGHGGFLDRLDSLLFNAPVLYYYALTFWSR